MTALCVRAPTEHWTSENKSEGGARFACHKFDTQDQLELPLAPGYTGSTSGYPLELLEYACIERCGQLRKSDWRCASASPPYQLVCGNFWPLGPLQLDLHGFTSTEHCRQLNKGAARSPAHQLNSLPAPGSARSAWLNSLCMPPLSTTDS